jgi:hypothetical protein
VADCEVCVQSTKFYSPLEQRTLFAVIKQIPVGLCILHSHLSEIWLKDSLQIGPKFSVVVKLMWHCQLSRTYFPFTVLYRAGYSLVSFSTHMWRAKAQ